jgi:hypothetical protein
MINIHAVSFASEGYPHDEGLPLGHNMLLDWGKMCIDGGATTYTWFTPSMLNTDEDAWCVKRYSDEHTMKINPGYHKVGLGAWRIVILRKVMDISADGDVVLVHCANYNKYPHMKMFAKNLRAYVMAVTQLTDVYSPPHCVVGNYTTKDVLELIPDVKIRSMVVSAPMGQCRLIVVKVNERTRGFIELLEETLKNRPLLLSPCRKIPCYTPFSHCTAEQSVFNVLAYREGFFPVNWRGTWVDKLKDAACHPGSGVEQVLNNYELTILPSWRTPNRIAFVIPMDIPRHSRYLTNLLKLVSAFSDVFIVVTEKKDENILKDTSEIFKICLSDFLTSVEIKQGIERKCMPTLKKWIGLKYLLTRFDGTNHYRYVVCCDCEMEVIRPIDHEFVEKLQTQWTFLGDHPKTFREVIMKSKFFLGKDDTEHPCGNDLMTWWSGLPLYEMSTLRKFMELVDVQSLVHKLSWSIFDHLVYQSYAIKYVPDSRFMCFTHDLGCPSGWSLEGKTTLRKHILAAKNVLEIMWLPKKIYENNKDIVSPYIVYHLDR